MVIVILVARFYIRNIAIVPLERRLTLSSEPAAVQLREQKRKLTKPQVCQLSRFCIKHNLFTNHNGCHSKKKVLEFSFDRFSF